MLGSISCKCFNLGCVLQPSEKSELPAGMHLTILSSLPVWQEVFAAPCFSDDRLLWFVLAHFREWDVYRGVHICELGLSELYHRGMRVQCLCPLNSSLFLNQNSRALLVNVSFFWHLGTIICKYQHCNIYLESSFISFVCRNLFPLKFSVILREKISLMAPCSREFWGFVLGRQGGKHFCSDFSLAAPAKM